MGIPKFFYWISQRYPLSLTLADPKSIPCFDNLYLDMNGIIHACSHSNEENVSFRLTEETLFQSIFKYIDHLVRIVRPTGVFLLAVDGVAPRAKMNQQRARRFRSARDAQEKKEKSLADGTENLASSGEEPFDSNCITPGTEFMAKLTKHLEYFIQYKLNSDSLYQRMSQIILSSHEVPGEGEHKIMEYIRSACSNPDYNLDTRHCIYGLDADLIMLGLTSGQDNFALLREEVRFGGSKSGGGRHGKKHSTSTTINTTGIDVTKTKFFIMQLGIVREYLCKDFYLHGDDNTVYDEDEEFLGHKKDIVDVNHFERSVGALVNDFIFLSILVGNDFLPHLPHLHINSGAYQFIFDSYKRALIKYHKKFPQEKVNFCINFNGSINWDVFLLVCQELQKDYEQDIYDEAKADLDFMGRKGRNGSGPKLSVTASQKLIVEAIEKYVYDRKNREDLKLSVGRDVDVVFAERLAKELNLTFRNEGAGNILLTKANYLFVAEDNESEEKEIAEETLENESTDEEDEIFDRIFTKYHVAILISQEDLLTDKSPYDRWKAQYYFDKLHVAPSEQTPIVKNVVSEYLKGLEWVTKYYYEGVCDWGWFYPYHYSPFISDICSFIQSSSPISFKFTLGEPFRPFEQLMGVMPAASSKLLPKIYRDLMSDPDSPIIDFYPKDFSLDLNGKKNDWEAVILIPFIDEARLLKAMRERESKMGLLPEEQIRNSRGTWREFSFQITSSPYYVSSSLKHAFPDIYDCRVVSREYPIDRDHKFVFGKAGIEHKGAVNISPGFPYLSLLPHTSSLRTIKGSTGSGRKRNDGGKLETLILNMSVHPLISKIDAGADAKTLIQNIFNHHSVESVAMEHELIVNFPYPYLYQYRCIGIVDIKEGIEYLDATKQQSLEKTELNGITSSALEELEKFDHKYAVRFPVDESNKFYKTHLIVFKLQKFTGLCFHPDGSRTRTVSDEVVYAPLQLCVIDKNLPIDDVIVEKGPQPLAKTMTMLSQAVYVSHNVKDTVHGLTGKIVGYYKGNRDVDILLRIPSRHVSVTPEFLEVLKEALDTTREEKFIPSYVAAKNYKIHPLLLSKITSTFLVKDASLGNTHNVGLVVKLDSRNRARPTYARKSTVGPGKPIWSFSEKCMSLVAAYREKFPSVLDSLEKTIEESNYVTLEMTVIEEIQKFLKEKGVGSDDGQLTSCNINSLDCESVSRIEGYLDSVYLKDLPAPEGPMSWLGADAESKLSKYSRACGTDFKEKLLGRVPVTQLVSSAFGKNPLNYENQHFSLGDRVVYVNDTGDVAFGSLGTVISILQHATNEEETASLKILLDIPSLNASNLRGLVSSYRGICCSRSDVIKLYSMSPFRIPPNLKARPNSTSSAIRRETSYAAATTPAIDPAIISTGPKSKSKMRPKSARNPPAAVPVADHEKKDLLQIEQGIMALLKNGIGNNKNDIGNNKNDICNNNNDTTSSNEKKIPTLTQTGSKNNSWRRKNNNSKKNNNAGSHSSIREGEIDSASSSKNEKKNFVPFQVLKRKTTNPKQ